MGPLKSPFLSGPRPTSAASTGPPPLRHRHNRLPPPPPLPPPLPLPLPPPPPLPPASSRPPLPSSALPLPPPYPPPHSLQMPPSPPLPPPPPLPPVTSHMTRLSPSPPSPPPRRTLRKPPRRRGASSDPDLPTIVLGLACPGSTLRVRKRHSVEQVVPAPVFPTTPPVCDTVFIEGLAAVPLEKLPPRKRLMRSYQNEAASTIQEVASHGHSGGLGDRPVSPPVEGDGNGNGDEFGYRPVSPAVDGDGFKNRPVSPTGDGVGEGFMNRSVSPTGDGDGEGFENRPVSPTGDGDGEGFKNRSVSPTGDGDGEGYENRSVSPTGDGDGEGFENRPVSPTGDGEGFGNQPVPLAVEGDGEGFGNLPVPLAVEGGGDAGAGIRGEEPQVYRDYDGLRAELHRLHVSRPALMMTKRLTPSDRTRDKGRLVLPDVLVRESPLLGTMTEAERQLVLAGGGLRVPAFDRVGRQYRMVLKRDRLARTYRLTGQWSLFLSRHGSMRDGDTVEVVAFRPPGWQAHLGRCGEGGLGMALVHCRGARRAARTFWNNWESDAADGGLVLPVGNPARQERLPRRRRRGWASRESQRPHPTFLGVAGPGAVYQNWSGA